MKKLVLLAFAMLLANPLWADVIGGWQMKGGHQLKVAYRDDQHIRMDVGQGYLLLKGDKVYSVSQQGKKWVAMDMSAMVEIMKQMGGMAMLQQQKQTIDDTDVSFSKTGRSETVAGVKGEVYQISIKHKGGKSKQGEVVLSNDKRLKTLSAATSELMGKMVGSMMGGSNPFAGQAHLFSAPGGGLLRYEQDMKLVELKETKLGGDYFDLPEGVEMMEMPAMPGMGGGMRGY